VTVTYTWEDLDTAVKLKQLSRDISRLLEKLGEEINADLRDLFESLEDVVEGM
jgi:hypothetical protein